MLMKNPRGGVVRSIQATVVGAVVIVAIIAVTVVVGFRLLGNPFTTETQDRSAPPVLLELRNLADFHAAQAQFEVTLDIEDDVQWVPSFIAGDRVQFIAVGTVDAVVDFRALDAKSVVVDEDTSTVTVTLGAVSLQRPVLDMELSHVMNRDRGLINRVGGMFNDNPTSETRLFREAEDKIANAATQTELVERAQTNVTLSLTSLIRALGYDNVIVEFMPAATPTAVETPTTEE
jgi:hypothetical protein